MPNLVGLSNPCAGGLVSLFVDGLKGTAVILLWCCCMACDFCDASYIMIDIINMYIWWYWCIRSIIQSGCSVSTIPRHFETYHDGQARSRIQGGGQVPLTGLMKGKWWYPWDGIPLSNQPHVHPYIVGIYWVYIAFERMELPWNCLILANFRPFVMPLHQVAGWRMRMSTGAKVKRCNAWDLISSTIPPQPGRDSQSWQLRTFVSIFPNFCRTEDDFEPWLLEDKMNSYSTSHVMGIGWNSGCKELADRDAPKPKVQVCCEPQQMPEGQKARFEPTFCTCVPCN